MSQRVNRRKSKSRVKSTRLTIAVFAVVIAVAAVLCIIFSGRVPPLDEPTVQTKSGVTADGIATSTQTQTHPYYQTEIVLPDAQTSPYPTEMKQFVDAQLADFHAQMKAHQDAKTLDKKQQSKFEASFERTQFAGYYNYTVTVAYNVATATSEAVTAKKIYLTDAGTGAYLSPSELFAEGFNYKQVFAQTMVNQMKALSSDTEADFSGVYERYSTDDALFDGRIYLDENGVNLMADSGESPKVPFVTVQYKSCYKSLKAVIPEEYLPKVPTPIDPELEKVVALTFDDGPNSKVTPKLLDLLDRYNAKATFFMIGYNINYYNDLVKEVAARGHCVANHSTDHSNYNKMSSAAVVKDVDTIFDKLESILGERPHLLRPPGGALTKDKAADVGVPVILWDVDPLDWKYRDAQTVSKNILNNVKSGDIVLSHDLYESTYEAMEIVIPELARQGYRFVTVDELLGINDGNYEYYAGKIITYRTLVKELRADGLL